MDEMRIESRFATSIVSKLITLLIKKKFGYDVKLILNEINASVIGGKTRVHLDLDAELDKEELSKILKSIDL